MGLFDRLVRRWTEKPLSASSGEPPKEFVDDRSPEERALEPDRSPEELAHVIRVPADHYLRTFPSDRLLAVRNASAPVEATGIVSTGMAAIVLLPGEMVDEVVATDRIQPLVQRLLAAPGGQSRKWRRDMKRPHGLQLSASWGDDHHYWLVLGPGSVDELAEATNEACVEILAHAYRQLLGSVVFAYREIEGAKRSVFLIFNDRAGAWYPFVPTPGSGDAEHAERDVQLERQLEAKLADDLPIERYRDGWFQFREAPF